MRTWSSPTIGLALLSMVALSACATGSIRKQDLYKDQRGFRIGKKAEIRDSTRNRQVLNVVAQYQQAITNKDFGTLERLISDDYYDNAGTTDTTSDDYGASELPGIWEKLAQYAEEIKYDITVKKVTHKRRRALVKYEYEYAYKVKVGDKPEWDAGVDVNQLELVSRNGNWKILSGL